MKTRFAAITKYRKYTIAKRKYGYVCKFRQFDTMQAKTNNQKKIDACYKFIIHNLQQCHFSTTFKGILVVN